MKNFKEQYMDEQEKEKGEMKMETEVFTKTKVLDIDTFETIRDQKTFDLETGKRVGFVRTETFQDYTGEITVRTKVIQ